MIIRFTNGRVVHESCKALLSPLVQSRRALDSTRGYTTLNLLFCPSLDRPRTKQRRHQQHFRPRQYASASNRAALPDEANGASEFAKVDAYTRNPENPRPEQPPSLESLLSSDTIKTAEEKQLIWRAWSGMSEDVQATRIQLLDSLLEMLTTEDPQDARRLRSLLDSKYGLIDSRQRPFYSFWAHMVLQESDIAFQYYIELPEQLRREHAMMFLKHIVETGDFSTGVKVWHSLVPETSWHGKQAVRDLLLLIPNLHTWQFLSVLPEAEIEPFKRIIRPAVVMHLAANGQCEAALQMLKHALSLDLLITDMECASTIRSLSQHDEAQKGIDLYHDLHHSISRPLLTLRSSLAVIAAASSLPELSPLHQLLDSNILTELGRNQDRVRLVQPYTTVMAAFARHGQTSEVDNLLTDFEKQGGKPDIKMISTLVHARVMRLEVTDAQKILKSCCEKYDLSPDLVIHNILLHLYVDTLDPYSADATIKALTEQGFVPDQYTASTCIDLFAQTNDPRGAELAFNNMKDSGVEPNIEIYGALLHAYVKAKDDKRIQTAVDMIESSGLRPNAHIMNILLMKAQNDNHSLTDMQALVAKMMQLGVVPTAATYTQLMRAHVREQNIEALVEVFNRLQSPNVYHYTVLMVGLLQTGREDYQKAVFHYYYEMLDRGIQPTYVTLAVLINAFMIEDTLSSARQANELLDTLLSTKQLDLSSKFSPRNVPPPSLYGPFLRQTKSGRIEVINAQTIYKKFLQSISGTDGRPDIRIYTCVMNLYYVTGQADKVRSLFIAVKKEADRLYRYGNLLQHSKSDDETDATTHEISQISLGARYILAAPLSILIQTLTKIERYNEVERVWAGLARQGYAFDNSNWNQFIRVQILQGHIEHACTLIAAHILGTETGQANHIHKETSALFNRALRALRESGTFKTESGGEESGSEIWRRIVSKHSNVLDALKA